MEQRRASTRASQVVHAEVYTDPDGGSDPATGGLADAVDAYGLTFEPSLFVADADGTIVERLDNVFDRVELARRSGRHRLTDPAGPLVTTGDVLTDRARGAGRADGRPEAAVRSMSGAAGAAGVS